EAERRPVAGSMLGLSTRLLQAQQHGDMRRGREVRQLDIGYRDSALALELPARIHGLRAGDRAPDAPVRGASGQPTRLFQLFQGTHWTLLAYQARLGAFATRAGLRVRHVGPDGDTVDAWGHVQDAYGLAPGDCVLVRPTATWRPSPMPAAWPGSTLTCAAWPCRRPLPAQTKAHARVPNMTACMQAGEHRPGHKAIPWRTVAIVGFIVCMYGAGMAAVLPVLPFY